SGAIPRRTPRSSEWMSHTTVPIRRYHKRLAWELFGWPSDSLLERLEEFFEERGAPVRHQVSPLADAESGERLTARGFRPVALSNVLFLDIRIVWDGKWSYDPSILVWEASQNEEEKWL